MQYRALFLLLRYFMIYKQCDFLLVNGLIGENVRQADNNEFPSAVAIVKINAVDSWPENNFICSGTLISYRDVLTSAHCLHNEQIDQIKLLIGSNDIRNSTEYFPSWLITYDEWAEQNGVFSAFPSNDLTILRLATNVSADLVRPARIVSIERNRLHGSQVYLATWGAIWTGRTPRMMQKITLTIHSNPECSNRYQFIMGEQYMLPNNYLCTAANPVALITPGDSGSGLYLDRNTIIGLTKSVCPSYNFVHPLSMNIHLYLHYYRNFIVSIVQHSI